MLKETSKKRKRHQTSVKVALRCIFAKEIETSIAEGSKLRRCEIRSGMAEIQILFPDLTELQVGEKLWTIACQEVIKRRQDA